MFSRFSLGSVANSNLEYANLICSTNLIGLISQKGYHKDTICETRKGIDGNHA